MDIKSSIKELGTNNIVGLDSFNYVINLYNKRTDTRNEDYINDTFIDFIHNDNLLNLKEYFKYYNNKKLRDFLINLVSIKNSDLIFDGNIKINSFADYFINNNFSNVYGNQINEIILNIFLINKDKYKNNFKNNDLLYDDFKNKFDVIFFDFPNDIHNKIHALCCKKIKDLKIRGTKSEPLLLQWICASLNKNGKAVLIVPDSLLFSDSTQNIETRKYLFNNFNIKRIIQLDESVYNNNINRDIKSITSTIKNSILYFENNGSTKNIIFEKMTINNNEIIIDKLFELNELNNMYSLYFKNYNINKSSNNSIEYDEIDNIYNIYQSIDEIKENIILCVPKYKNNNNFNLIISEKDKIDNDNYLYITNKFDDNFMIKYIKSIILNKIEEFTKGKMNQIDINKLKKYKIPILSKEKKDIISKYLELSDNIINNNLNKINMYNELKHTFINTIPNMKMIKLDKIGEINDNEDNIIGFIKNSLLAGTIYIPNEELSKNSHYFNITNNNYLLKYIYHYLKHLEQDLMETAKLTAQPNLNKSDILNLSIPDIDINNQNEIIDTCDNMDNSIELFRKEIDTINKKDIISIILKLYNC